MTNAPVTPRAPAVVAVLTIAWIIAALTSVWRCSAIVMAAWADQRTDNGVHAADFGHQAKVAVTVLAAVAVGGPALIATVAFANRMARTGAAYVVLAVVLGALTLPAVAGAEDPPAPSPSISAVCQEYSGGDSRCPGG